jgi:8-oxo-dGTP pyrophosphatase MutT (NUDIX family)
MSDAIRHAATIVLVRPRAATQEPEIFLVKRHRKSGFMASAYVYPGGKLDADDSHTDMLARTRGLSPEAALHRLAPAGPRLDDDVTLTGVEALAVHVAGVREVFEEAGILLADGLEATGEVLDAWRTEINADLGFRDLVARESLTLRPDQLHYFAHWITPDIEPRRFNTRFFLALAPDGQEGYHDETETVDSAWLAPAEALDRYAKGEIMLAPPTFRTLEDMAAFDTAASLLRGMVPDTVPTIMPRFDSVDGVMTMFMPGDPEYPSPVPVIGPTRVVLIDGRWWSRSAE